VTRRITYVDALKILGVENSQLLDTADRLLGGAIIGATAATGHLEIAALIHVRDELARIAHRLLAKFGERVRGASGKRRSDLLAAAHNVIAINAYFSALHDVELPIRAEQIELTKEDELRLAGASRASSRRLVDALIHAPLPSPSAHSPFEATAKSMRARYVQFSQNLIDFTSGLRIWDNLNQTQQSEFVRALNERVPVLATDRYQESFRDLAKDCPEYQIWADTIDNAATRYAIQQLGSDVARSLAGLELELRHLAAAKESKAAAAAERLTKVYTADLRKPIADTTPGEAAAGLTVPLLGEAYINPSCLIAECGSEAHPSEESWWRDSSVKWRDFQWFLGGYLISPSATELPLVILGQPGSGKSILTRILAARLPGTEYVPLRVELRKVPADASLDEQLEHAIRQATGTRMDWSDFVSAIGEALPVIMLDGFDELLQGTGISHSDFLERIREFQRRELDNDRGVAVLVTSRTVVADRVRFPQGTVVARLEPFDKEQIGKWLVEWRAANMRYFRGRDRRPLDVATAMKHSELARQPLLLMMLAFYDAAGNALRKQSARIGQAELYERLLKMFLRREISKDSASLSEPEADARLAIHLRQLAVVALGMFNRGRQSITADELRADFEALLGPPNQIGEVRIGSFARALPEHELTIGRFFFIHESQSSIDNRRFAVYEFLHATFGEFLVAWMILQTLQHLETVTSAERNTASFASSDVPIDDALYNILSFSLLTDRIQVIVFLRELLVAARHSSRTDSMLIVAHLLRMALAERRSASRSIYRPKALGLPERLAVYSANLLILCLDISDTTISTRTLFDGSNPLDDWRRSALFWQSQLDSSAFDGLVNSTEVRRTVGADGVREVMLGLRSRFDVSPEGADSNVNSRISTFASALWTVHEDLQHIVASGTVEASSKVDRLINHCYFLCSDELDLMLHALYPLLRASERAAGLVIYLDKAGRALSMMNALVNYLYRHLDPSSRLALQDLIPDLEFEDAGAVRVAAGDPSDLSLHLSPYNTLIELTTRSADLREARSSEVEYALQLESQDWRSGSEDEYWISFVNSLAARGFGAPTSAADASDSEIVERALRQVNPVHISKVDPESATAALRIARECSVSTWAADQGLAILALMDHEPLGVVPQVDVDFVLTAAEELGVSNAAVALVRDRWASSAGVRGARRRNPRQ
jgi:hypothetical protein